MDKQVKFQEPVFGAGAPKANETSIRATSTGERQTGRSSRHPESCFAVTRPFQAAEQRAPASPASHVAYSDSRRSRSVLPRPTRLVGRGVAEGAPASFLSLAAGALLVSACTGSVAGPPEEGWAGSGATSSSGATGSGASGGSGNATGGKGSSGKGGSSNASGGSGNPTAGSNSGAGTSGTAGATGTPEAVFGAFTRLTQAEYRATVLDAFGADPNMALIPVDGRIGQYTSNASVSPDPVHPYLLAAEDLAVALIPSELPACDVDAVDECLRDNYAEPLARLYRRPVTDAELTELGGMLATVVDGGGTTTDASRAVIVTALLNPDFLFRASPVASDPAAKARRLAESVSYTLWDAPPDSALTAVAEASATELPELLREQAMRLAGDTRATPVVARFLAQWLRVDTDLRLGEAEFATSPRYLELLAYAADALENDPPVRDLVAGTRGFVHEDNVDAYGLDSVSGSDDVAAVDWTASSPQRGLVSQDLFADATRHPDEGRRPIFRGKLVRTSLLCDTIAAPSAELLELADEISDRTADPRCAGCHSLLEPIGRAFAALDTDHEGEVEAAEIVDHPGLDGTYEDLAAMLNAIADSRSFAECFSRHWLAFFLEQPLDAADPTFVSELADLVQSGGSLRDIIGETATGFESRSNLATPWCEGP
jgi:hypothetical protein